MRFRQASWQSKRLPGVAGNQLTPLRKSFVESERMLERDSLDSPGGAIGRFILSTFSIVDMDGMFGRPSSAVIAWSAARRYARTAFRLAMKYWCAGGKMLLYLNE